MGNIVRLPRKAKPVYQCTGASVTLEKLERGMYGGLLNADICNIIPLN